MPENDSNHKNDSTEITMNEKADVIIIEKEGIINISSNGGGVRVEEVDPSSNTTNNNKNGHHNNNNNFQYYKKPQKKPNYYKEPSLTMTIPKESIAILIGTGGRNICLVVKMANVYIQTNDKDGIIHIFERNVHSDVDLAQRMITSIIAGGVLRWFNHPSSTNKYYHVSVRGELKDLVTSNCGDKCSLQLLRSQTGHLCLFICIDKWEKNFDTAMITNLRPVILEKISELANCGGDDEEV